MKVGRRTCLLPASTPGVSTMLMFRSTALGHTEPCHNKEHAEGP